MIGKSLIGSAVAKQSDNSGVSSGTIVAYDAAKKTYLVRYLDGPVEELTNSELKPMLMKAPQKQKEQSKPKPKPKPKKRNWGSDEARSELQFAPNERIEYLFNDGEGSIGWCCGSVARASQWKHWCVLADQL